MTKSSRDAPEGKSLRREAETRLSRIVVEAGQKVAPDDRSSLLQELQVHQIELEMQNEALHVSRDEAAALLEKYVDLYDFAPVGYLTLDPDGAIRQANLTGATLIGVPRGELVDRRLAAFLTPESRPALGAFLAELRGGHQGLSCEVCVQREGGEPVWLHLGGRLFEAVPECRISMVDVTERRRAEEALHESEERLRSLVEQAADAMFVHDFEGRFVEVNRQACESLGYAKEELLGMSVTDVELDFGLASAQAEWSRIEPDAPFTLLGHQRRKDGTVFPVEIRFARFELRGRRNFMALVRDITDRRASEEALQRQGAFLALAQSFARAGTWSWEFASGQLWWSPEMFRLFGLDPERDDASFDTWRRAVHPDDRETAERRIYEAVERHEFLDNNYRIVLPGGETLWIEALGRAEYEASGAPIRMAGLCVDVTERRRIEEELAESRRLLLEVTDNSLALMYVVDTEGRYLLANRKLSELFGVPEREMVGQTRLRFMPAEVAEKHRANDLQVIRDRGPRIFEESNLEAGGTRSYLTLKYPLFRKDGTVYAVGGMSIDITDRKNAEMEIQRLNTDLEARVAARTEELEAFAYSVSHDLRAPLRAIEGFSGILATDHSEQLIAEQVRLVDAIRRNARKMSELIDDLLDFSRVGRHEVRLARLEMKAIARSAFEEVVGGPEARAMVDFTLGALPGAQGDPALIRQVWINLLSNAVKFSAKGEMPSIEVGGALDGDFALYYVRDNGAGFDPKHADKLFGVFQRLHGASEFEGTGIGLALVKRIVERHRGRVWAEGEVGKGATFSFTLGSAVEGAEAIP